MQKIALDVKIIPQLLSAVENDQPILTGSLPTLLAITGLIRDMEGRFTLGSYVGELTATSLQNRFHVIEFSTVSRQQGLNCCIPSNFAWGG